MTGRRAYMAKTTIEVKQRSSDFADYLTFRLDLVKSEMLRRANLVYRRELGLEVRTLRLLRAVCDAPGVTAKGLQELTLIEKTILSKVLAEMIAMTLVRGAIHTHEGRSEESRGGQERVSKGRDRV